MTDREFWILVRRALIIIVRAIEDKFINLPAKAETTPKAERVTTD